MVKKTRDTVPKKKSALEKRAAKSDSVSRAKKDATNFVRSVASFIPGIGTLLTIESAYNDGMKLLQSAPQALIEIGNRSRQRLEKRLKNRVKKRIKDFFRRQYGEPMCSPLGTIWAAVKSFPCLCE